MAFLRIATVDAVNGEVIREALHDAEIACHINEVRPFRQIEYLRHQHRSMIDVEVEPEREDDARAILARLELEAEEAVMAQAGGGEPAERAAEPAVTIAPETFSDGRPRRDRKLTPLDRPRLSAAKASKLARWTAERRAELGAQAEPRSAAVALLVALLVPVAGPAYAGAWGVVGLSLALHTGGAILAALGAWDGWFPDGIGFAGVATFVAARLLDVVSAPLVVHRGARDRGSR
jgi:hypothetical protein